MALSTISGEIISQKLNDNFSYLNERKNDLAINVKDYGAVGNNSIYDYDAIVAAVTEAETLASLTYHPVLYFPASTGYKISAGITVPKYISVIMEAPIIYHGTANETALTIGIANTGNFVVDLKLNVKRNTQSDWLSEDCIGVKIINANTCNINIVQSYGFTIGCQFIGDGQGFAYNNTTLGYIISNKYGVDCNTNNAGWCNENIYINGRFGVDTGTNTTLNRYGVRITSKESYYSNNNVFFKPSFELNASDASGEAVPILLEYAKQNSFLKIRNGSNDTTTTRISNDSTENEITTGYGLLSIDDQSAYPVTKYGSIRDQIFNETGNCIFLSGPLHKRSCYYDGSTSVNIPGVHIGNGGSASIVSSGSNMTISDNYLEVGISRGVGTFVNTTIKKRFIIRTDVEDNYGGRIIVRCYDENGVVLDDLGAGHPYVKGKINRAPVYTSGWGKAYSTGVDAEDDYYFTVGDDVKYIAVYCAKGTNVLRIRSFSIHSVDGDSPATWTGYEEMIPSVNLGSTFPTVGTWTQGRIILDPTATAGGTLGWLCVAGNTAGGTWKAWGNISI